MEDIVYRLIHDTTYIGGNEFYRRHAWKKCVKNLADLGWNWNDLMTTENERPLFPLLGRTSCPLFFCSVLMDLGANILEPPTNSFSNSMIFISHAIFGTPADMVARFQQWMEFLPPKDYPEQYTNLTSELMAKVHKELTNKNSRKEDKERMVLTQATIGVAEELIKHNPFESESFWRNWFNIRRESEFKAVLESGLPMPENMPNLLEQWASSAGPWATGAALLTEK